MQNSRVRPDFLIIGAAKAATTALSNMLAQHPKACIVRGKEPHFFSTNRYYELGWNGYQQLYSHCQPGQVTGDASTSYSRIRYHPDLFPRLKRHIPDARIIYMVRDPLERMVSAYVERLASADLNESFASINQAVRQQPMIIDSSRYREVYDEYTRHFDEKKIKVVWFEEFIENTVGVFSEVCKFLSIDDSIRIDLDEINLNTRDDARNRMKDLGREHVELNTRWDDATRQWVIDQIRDDNLRFLSYFGKPRDYWGNIFD